MTLLLELYRTPFLLFTLVLARISGLFLLAPLFAASFIPMRIRAYFAVGIAVLVTLLFWHVPVEDPQTLINYGVYLGGEVLIGLTIGLGLQILFSGLQLAGQIVGQMSGMHLANLVDPAFEEQVPIFSQFLYLVALAVYVLMGGPRLALEGLLSTFESIPPGGSFPMGGLVELLTVLLGQSFDLGLRVAAPAMVALLVAIVSMGLISRTLPQLNVMIVGLSLNAVVMLGVLSISLGVVIWTFQDQVEPTMELLTDAFR